LFLIYLLIGVVLRFTARGFQPELLIEIQSYRIPPVHTLVSKMWMRISGFLREALPIITGAVLFVNILYQFKLFEYLGRFAAPVITRLWRMPPESVVPLLVGILRKYVARGTFAASRAQYQAADHRKRAACHVFSLCRHLCSLFSRA